MNKHRLLWVGLALFLAGCAGHLPLGSQCSSKRDCAGKLVCDANGLCAKGNCQPAGGKCSTNDDCCGALYCSGRVCR